MEYKEFDQQYTDLCAEVSSGNLKQAMERISRLMRQVPGGDYYYRLESLSENYRSLLKYAFQGYRDPKREEILAGLSVSLLTLADEIRHDWKEKEMIQTRLERLLVKKEFGEDPAAVNDKIDAMIFGKKVDKMIGETGPAPAPFSPVDLLFKLIWLTPRWDDGLFDRIRKMFGPDALEWQEKSLLVSAVVLGVLDFFDPRKILLLIEITEAGETQVSQRALTGLVLALTRYDHRLKFYPEILAKAGALFSSGTVRSDIQAILLQLLMAQETEKINKAFEEEVLPGMREVMPRLEDKLDLGNIFEESDIEGKNPAWKDLIEEVPGLFDSIEKFTKMQIEGADVFMSTFSQLKRFDFFTRIGNWFVPFYTRHPDLLKETGGEETSFVRLLEGLERAFYLCNSDKYSFALNFNAVPEQQRSRIVTYFEAELEQMKEMASEEELLGQTESSATVFTQYIQDLYRFYKLYPFRNEFEDVFGERIHFSRLGFYRNFFDTEKFTEQLAAFYFDRQHYPEAIEMYEYLAKTEKPRGEYYEKMGYACQKMNRYRKAIEYYKKADLFDSNRIWVLKKLGWCYVKIKDYRSALPCFEEASRLQPEELSLKIQVANCYLNLKEYEQALNQYSQASYFRPDDLKVLRPVAYCQFALGKLEEAAGLYEKILASESPKGYDYMNAANVQLCLGKRAEALEWFRQCRKDKSLTLENFRSAFEEDAPLLIRNGIRPEDIPLLEDAFTYEFES
ncbi:MAG TPA: tetratricopeptide repeat protein [Bacteroidales bacterium]|nr:tetratricopeptide repeat protein [Bacteroidales bacterium]